MRQWKNQNGLTYYSDDNGATWHLHGGTVTLEDNLPLTSLNGFNPDLSGGGITVPYYQTPAALSQYASDQDRDFGDTLLNFITAPLRVIGGGISATVDGIIDRGMYPYNVTPQSPYGVVYTNGGVRPMISAPGTVAGPSIIGDMSWLQKPVIGTVTGAQIGFGLAALVGLVLVAKAVK